MRRLGSVVVAAALVLLCMSADCAINDTQNLPPAKSQLPLAEEVSKPTALEAKLPLASLGGKCGAGIATCMHGCCSQQGFCGISPSHCGPLCQVPFSSSNALCRGKAHMDPPKTETLPLVGPGKVCGAFVARCKRGCCNELNFCEDEVDAKTNKTSFACSLSSCVLAASPNSKACGDAHRRIKPVTRKYKFVAEWGRAAPDGFEVKVVLINGAYPAPTIFANVGDRVVVEFHNRLARPTTVHFHGVKQVNTNIMDGVGDVTQVAVDGSGGKQSNGTESVFLYDFVADVAGNYWYHDHYSALTYVDGLRGVLVVSDPWSPAVPSVMRSNNDNNKGKNNNEPVVVFVADQYHDDARRLSSLYVNASNTEGIEPVPASQWINGWAGVETPWCGGGSGGGGGGGGGGSGSGSGSGGGGNSTAKDPQPPCKSAVINTADPIASCDAASGPNAMIVVVSGSAFAYFGVHLESEAELRARVLSVDASLLAEPVPVNLTADDPLELAPGQRYGIELCAVGKDPSAARKNPARIVVRAPIDQFSKLDADSNGLGLDASPPCAPDTMKNCSIVAVASAVLDLKGRQRGQATYTVIEGLSKLPPWPAEQEQKKERKEKEQKQNQKQKNETADDSHAEELAESSAPGGLRMLKFSGPTRAPPPNATKTVPLAISTGYLSADPPSPQYFFFNNITFSVPLNDSSLLQQRLSTGLPPNASPGTAGYNVLDFSFGDVVDLVVTNKDGGVHPLHLHGQSFWVMAQGPTDAASDPATSPPLRPLFVRDVAVVQPGSYIVMRFTASNPGMWLYHCHIEYHLAAGLGLVISTSE